MLTKTLFIYPNYLSFRTYKRSLQIYLNSKAFLTRFISWWYSRKFSNKIGMVVKKQLAYKSKPLPQPRTYRVCSRRISLSGKWWQLPQFSPSYSPSCMYQVSGELGASEVGMWRTGWGILGAQPGSMRFDMLEACRWSSSSSFPYPS